MSFSLPDERVSKSPDARSFYFIMQQLIERHRLAIKAALRRGDIDAACFHVRIVVGIRICAGEIQPRKKSHGNFELKISERA